MIHDFSGSQKIIGFEVLSSKNSIDRVMGLNHIRLNKNKDILLKDGRIILIDWPSSAINYVLEHSSNTLLCYTIFYNRGGGG